MTDQERSEYFKRKHDEVVERLCGPAKYPIPDDIECRVIDHNWDKGISFYDLPRIHKHMNSDVTGLYEYQKQMRENNGVVRTRVESGLDAAVPDPIK